MPNETQSNQNQKSINEQVEELVEELDKVAIDDPSRVASIHQKAVKEVSPELINLLINKKELSDNVMLYITLILVYKQDFAAELLLTDSTYNQQFPDYIDKLIKDERCIFNLMMLYAFRRANHEYFTEKDLHVVRDFLGKKILTNEYLQKYPRFYGLIIESLIQVRNPDLVKSLFEAGLPPIPATLLLDILEDFKLDDAEHLNKITTLMEFLNVAKKNQTDPINNVFQATIEKIQRLDQSNAELSKDFNTIIDELSSSLSKIVNSNQKATEIEPEPQPQTTTLQANRNNATKYNITINGTTFVIPASDFSETSLLKESNFGILYRMQYVGNNGELKAYFTNPTMPPIYNNNNEQEHWLVLKKSRIGIHQDAATTKREFNEELSASRTLVDSVYKSSPSKDPVSVNPPKFNIAFPITIDNQDGTEEPALLEHLEYYSVTEQNKKQVPQSADAERIISLISSNPITEGSNHRITEVLHLANFIHSMFQSIKDFHSRDHIHGDIGLRNFLISTPKFFNNTPTRFEVKLADYGFSKFLDGKEFVRQERTVFPLDSANWELAISLIDRNEKLGASKKSDLYALRITLYELLASYLGTNKSVIVHSDNGEPTSVIQTLMFVKNKGDAAALESYYKNALKLIPEGWPVYKLFDSLGPFLLTTPKSTDEDEKLLDKCIGDFVTRMTAEATLSDLNKHQLSMLPSEYKLDFQNMFTNSEESTEAPTPAPEQFQANKIGLAAVAPESTPINRSNQYSALPEPISDARTSFGPQYGFMPERTSGLSRPKLSAHRSFRLNANTAEAYQSLVMLQQQAITREAELKKNKLNEQLILEANAINQRIQHSIKQFELWKATPTKDPEVIFQLEGYDELDREVKQLIAKANLVKDLSSEATDFISVLSEQIQKDDNETILRELDTQKSDARITYLEELETKITEIADELTKLESTPGLSKKLDLAKVYYLREIGKKALSEYERLAELPNKLSTKSETIHAQTLSSRFTTAIINEYHKKIIAPFTAQSKQLNPNVVKEKINQFFALIEKIKSDKDFLETTQAAINDKNIPSKDTQERLQAIKDRKKEFKHLTIELKQLIKLADRSWKEKIVSAEKVIKRDITLIISLMTSYDIDQKNLQDVVQLEANAHSISTNKDLAKQLISQAKKLQADKPKGLMAAFAKPLKKAAKYIVSKFNFKMPGLNKSEQTTQFANKEVPPTTSQQTPVTSYSAIPTSVRPSSELATIDILVDTNVGDNEIFILDFSAHIKILEAINAKLESINVNLEKIDQILTQKAAPESTHLSSSHSGLFQHHGRPANESTGNQQPDSQPASKKQ